jgi:hypothetical protein
MVYDTPVLNPAGSGVGRAQPLSACHVNMTKTALNPAASRSYSAAALPMPPAGLWTPTRPDFKQGLQSGHHSAMTRMQSCQQELLMPARLLIDCALMSSSQHFTPEVVRFSCDATDTDMFASSTS